MLCQPVSIFFVPQGVIFYHCIENDNELTDACSQSDFLVFAAGHQTLIESTDSRIMQD